MDFRTFARIVAARWRVVATALVVCCAGAATVTALQTRTYESSATVLMSVTGTITVTEAFEAAQASAQRLSSYAEIAGGRTVAQRVIDQTGIPMTADDLVENTTVDYTPDSAIFTLTITDVDPQRVATLTAAMADQFLALVPEIEASLRGPLPGSQASATVVEQPVVPSQPVGPSPLRNGALGLLAGVLTGIVAALVRNGTDRTVRSRGQLEQVAGLPNLASLAPITLPSGKQNAAWFGAGDPMDEEMRGLRSRLRKLSGPQARTLLVTAPACDAGTTSTALNLALAYAETGERVVLVEGDTRQAVIAALVGVSAGPSLVDVLADRDLLGRAVTATPHANVSVVAADTPSGADPNLGAPVLPAAIEELAGMCDRVIVDGPPVLATADAGLLAAACSATVVVVRNGVTGLADVEDTLDTLRAAGGTVIGTVLTDTPIPRHTRAATRTYRSRVGSSA